MAPSEREQTETRAIALLRIREALQQAFDERAGRRPDTRAPRDQARRRPLEMPLMRLRAMHRIGRVAPLERAARMHGAPFVWHTSGFVALVTSFGALATRPAPAALLRDAFDVSRSIR